ncbi:MAG: nucleotidyltransferase domain-containing protein [Synergistaceae bacterium]|jgi:predicted nucleotidyltransferase|nr:nucleotidyltransferase domain-containing protein [Synergistaceae bacterium]
MLKPESIAYIKTVAERFGAEKILLFGSCLEKSQDEANDIDLVVYGLDAFQHWDMACEIMWAPELDKKPIDLVRAEDDLPIMVYAEKGMPIYEREVKRRRETVSM